MSSILNNLYRFAEFSLDAQGRVLTRGQAAVPLTPKAFDVLLLLVQNAGRTVTKDELMKAVWRDSFVEESNLTQTIFMVRKALDETAERRYILNVPGRVYRIVVPVAETPIDEAASGGSPTEAVVAPQTLSDERNASDIQSPPYPRNWSGGRSAAIALATVAIALIAGFAISHRYSHKAPAEQPGRIMLAVLPFQNLTGDPAQEYVSDGLTEEMLTQLGTLNPQRLGVIARTSVMHYKTRTLLSIRSGVS